MLHNTFIQRTSVFHGLERIIMRSDDVSPFLMVSCAAGIREKIPITFAHRVDLFIWLFFPPWCVCIGFCVHRGWSIERHRKGMDFGRERDCRGPYLAAPPTSARVQSRFA